MDASTAEGLYRRENPPPRRRNYGGAQPSWHPGHCCPQKPATEDMEIICNDVCSMDFVTCLIIISTMLAVNYIMNGILIQVCPLSEICSESVLQVCQFNF